MNSVTFLGFMVEWERKSKEGNSNPFSSIISLNLGDEDFALSKMHLA